MITISAGDLGNLAEQILIAHRRLMDGNGLRIYAPGRERVAEVPQIALRALESICGEPVECPDIARLTHSAPIIMAGRKA